MNFEIKRKDDIGGEPSLAAMTETAIRILKKQAKGFFLLVEGRMFLSVIFYSILNYF